MIEILKALNNCLNILFDPRNEELIKSLKNLGKTLNDLSKEKK